MLLGSFSTSAATPEQVDAALRKSKEYMYSKMDKVKYWEEVPVMDEKAGSHSTSGRQWGGLTAISVYALLASGEKHLDPKLNPAVEWIKKQRIIGNYALGLRAQLWTFLPPTPEVKQLAMKDRDYLYKGMHRNPLPKAGDKDRIGFYPYWFNDDRTKMQPGDKWWDLSISQYGVLGMWACEQVDGVEVPIDYWAETDKAWKAAMYTDAENKGGWAYRRGAGAGNELKPGDTHEMVKPTMTAAGVATLFITQDYLLQYSNFGFCKGGANNMHLEAGLAWMDKNVGKLLGGGQFYGMYGVERIGVASGKKYFGTVDWYNVGADYLVKAQAADGSWGGSIPNTCFAMLFLARGRSPVIMNKLEYSLNDPANAKINLPWAQRPRDVANFSRFAGKMSEQYFNWQVVNLRVSPDDLHDAPILYVSGSKKLDFTDAEIAKLREYTAAGGLILFNADCADEEFVKSIVGPTGIGKKLFPKYEFRELPAAHPIYVDQVYQARNWKTKPKVLAVSNGVREMAILIPDADVGRAWQTRAEKTKEEAYQLGMNIFYYAAEKGNVRYRGATHVVKADPKIKPTVNVKVARIMVGDNPDPEPWGWQRLSAILHNQAGVGVKVEPVKPGEKKLVSGPTGFQMAHLTGTGNFTMSAPQRDEIKAFVNGGGTLVVDAAGGDAAFADAAEKELAAIFGGDASAIGPIIAPDERVYEWAAPFKIAKFDYRKYTRGKLSGKLNVPRIRAIERAGKQRVFYSREDISAGMLGQPCDGILGYEPETATAIMRNIVLYVAYNGRPPRPTTSPATAPTANPAAPAAAAQ
ncbi:DUF4159 domain-containing protein [Humisphaera borealis]|uniref:DUF4159 domain-containing protein n=1 Tax=Humisphaera borealis TaxID=2807512 RepID=A0A7M2X526_9BACT|nr:DUF4159 domain-containing protein [Humisphaera borealis]QOV91900.1 DUF4159 domain-containing protein [Humisphaera borealis]